MKRKRKRTNKNTSKRMKTRKTKRAKTNNQKAENTKARMKLVVAIACSCYRIIKAEKKIKKCKSVNK